MQTLEVIDEGVEVDAVLSRIITGQRVEPEEIIALDPATINWEAGERILAHASGVDGGVDFKSARKLVDYLANRVAKHGNLSEAVEEKLWQVFGAKIILQYTRSEKLMQACMQANIHAETDYLAANPNISMKMLRELVGVSIHGVSKATRNPSLGPGEVVWILANASSATKECIEAMAENLTREDSLREVACALRGEVGKTETVGPGAINLFLHNKAASLIDKRTVLERTLTVAMREKVDLNIALDGIETMGLDFVFKTIGGAHD